MAVLVAVGALGRPASATLNINFNPTGSSATAPVTITTIDERPGNAMAVGFYDAANGFAEPGVGSTFTLLYQASVGQLLDPSGNQAYSYGTNQLTVVASFQETVTYVSSDGSVVRFAPTGPGTAAIYYSPTATFDNLKGTDFKTGTLVYTGTSTAGGTGIFGITSQAGGALDQFGTDNYVGITSVSGQGSSSVTFKTTYVNPNFFVSGIPADLSLLVSNTDTSNQTPFTKVDPATQMYNAATDTYTPGVASVGTVNGVPGQAANVMFQADGVTAFSSVPEPSTLVSALSCGLLGLIGFVRHHRRNRATRV